MTLFMQDEHLQGNLQARPLRRLAALLVALAACALAAAIVPAAEAQSTAHPALVRHGLARHMRCVVRRAAGHGARRAGRRVRVCKHSRHHRPAALIPAAKTNAAANALLAALLPALEEVADVLGGTGGGGTGGGGGGGGTPAAPTAAFVYSPASPSTGQAVAFDGSSSTCAATPCSYGWSDDGGLAPQGQGWTLGSGQTLSFTFREAGTKYIRLTVTDALGRAASVEHTLEVAPAEESSGKLADITPPAIAGTLLAGQTLTASPGTWTGGPTSFTYRWQRCKTGGEPCANIGGAGGST